MKENEEKSGAPSFIKTIVCFGFAGFFLEAFSTGRTHATGAALILGFVVYIVQLLIYFAVDND